MSTNGHRSLTEARAARAEWRWAVRIERPYSAEDVIKLRGSVRVEHTLARRGAERLLAARPRATTTCARSAR